MDSQQSLELITSTHFPGSLEVPAAEDVTYDRQRAVDLSVEDGADFITEEKVVAAIASFGAMKAAGPDGFKPLMLRKMQPHFVRHLTKMYKACILLGYTPKAWCTSNVIFIPKPGKDDYSLPRSFRPISLMSFLMKALERIVLWHLQDGALREHPFNVNQHAFRKARSCDSALSNMVEYLEEAQIRRKYAVGVFLYIQGRLTTPRLRAWSRGWRTSPSPPPIIRWYEHFLRHRNILVSYKGQSLVRWLTQGPPQGGGFVPHHVEPSV